LEASFHKGNPNCRSAASVPALLTRAETSALTVLDFRYLLAQSGFQVSLHLANTLWPKKRNGVGEARK
jgi:hypothetical protein